MRTLHITVTDKRATYHARDGAIVCNNDDYQIKFTFDDEWAAHDKKKARFIWGGAYKDVEFTGDICPVPRITGALMVEVGVYAGDLKTTTGANIPCLLTILDGSNIGQPEQVKEYRDQAAAYADEAKEAAGRAAEEAAEAAAEKIAEIGIVQTTGGSETSVMSQKATTEAIKSAMKFDTKEERDITDLLTLTEGKFYSLDRVLVALDTSACTELISVSKGDVFKITTRYGYYTPILVEFDASQTAVKSVGVYRDGNATATEYEYTVPDGVSYIVINNRQQTSRPMVVIATKNETVKERIKANANAVEANANAIEANANAIEDNTKGIEALFSTYVVERGLMNLPNVVLDTIDYGISIEIKNGKIHINGRSSKDLHIKLTNGYAVSDLGNGRVPEWNKEKVDFIELGETYYVSMYLESGSPESTATTAVISARDSSYNNVVSPSKSPATVTTDVAFVKLFIANNVTFDDAVYVPVVEKSQTPTPLEEIEQVFLDKNIGVQYESLPPIIKDFFYNCVKEFNYELIHEDGLETYGAVQGMCTDGEYLYYSIYRGSDASNTLLRKYSLATNEVVLSVENHSYGHANGIAYIPHENVLYVVHMDEIGTVSKVNATTLEYIESFSLYDVLSPAIPWYVGVGAVAYDDTREKIVFLIRSNEEADGRKRKGFAIFDKYMRFEKIIKTEYVESDAYSGISTDKDFIYLTVSNPTHTERGEWLIMYDWHGNEVSKIELIGYGHIEAQAKIGDVFYFADNRNSYDGATIERATPTDYVAISKIDTLLKYNLN